MKKEFLQLLEDAIEEQGRNILESSADDNKSMMHRLFEFKRNIDTLIYYACENESEVQQLKNLALSTCINASETATSSIALYTDFCFTEDFKNKSEADVSQGIHDLVSIITLLRDRDIFLKQYAKDLTVRLANDTSVSIEDEGKMIERMREEFGANAIFKILSIMQDINSSSQMNANIMTRFRHIGEVINVKVIRDSCWPFQAPEEIMPAQSLRMYQEVFTSFFYEMHPNRKLSWVYNVGKVEVKPLFTEKNYLMSMTPL